MLDNFVKHFEFENKKWGTVCVEITEEYDENEGVTNWYAHGIYIQGWNKDIPIDGFVGGYFKENASEKTIIKTLNKKLENR